MCMPLHSRWRLGCPRPPLPLAWLAGSHTSCGRRPIYVSVLPIHITYTRQALTVVKLGNCRKCGPLQQRRCGEAPLKFGPARKASLLVTAAFDAFNVCPKLIHNNASNKKGTKPQTLPTATPPFASGSLTAATPWLLLRLLMCQRAPCTS